MLLRDLLGTTAGREQKHGRIDEMLELHPGLPFVLLGDSGERDPEIYADMVRAHPGRILAVYIREVRLDPGDGRVEQVTGRVGPRRPVRAGGRQRRRTPARGRARAAVSPLRTTGARANGARRGRVTSWSWRESNPRPRASNQVFSGCSP